MRRVVPMSLNDIGPLKRRNGSHQLHTKSSMPWVTGNVTRLGPSLGRVAYVRGVRSICFESLNGRAVHIAVPTDRIPCTSRLESIDPLGRRSSILIFYMKLPTARFVQTTLFSLFCLACSTSGKAEITIKHGLVVCRAKDRGMQQHYKETFDSWRTNSPSISW